MSFQTEIKKSYSEKFPLIRAGAARNIEVVQQIDPTIFYAPFFGNINKVFNNLGTELTRVYVAPSSDNEYFYNESTQIISVLSLTVIDSIIVYHYLFLTTGKNRAIGINPLLPDENLIEWRGVIINSPSFSQSLDNINSGVVSISNSSIELINDGEFDFLFSRVDTVRNQLFDVWFCCNGVSNIEHVFTGVLVDCSKNGMRLTIRTKDNLELLKKTCLMGDTIEECELSTSQFVNADPSKIGQTIPFLFGGVSDYGLKALATNGTGLIDSEKLREAFCTSFSDTVSVTTNREFIACRERIGGGIADIVTSSVSGDYFFLFASADDFQSFFQYDTFKASNTYFKTVSAIPALLSVQATLISGAAISGSVLLRKEKIPVVIVVQNGIEYFCVNGRDYTVSETTTSGGNNLLKITFDNNFEANVSMPSALDPKSDTVKYRASLNRCSHETAVEWILDSCDAKNDLTGTGLTRFVNFMVPLNKESYPSDHLTYLEKICETMSSYVFQKLDGKFDYKCFSSPSSPVVISKSDYLSGSLDISENSQDVYTTLNVTFDYVSDTFYKIMVESKTSENLFGLKNILNYSSIDTQTTVRDEFILQKMLKSSTYKFDLKNVGYDWTIGQSINIDGKDLIVIGISKGLDKLEITAIDTFTQ